MFATGTPPETLDGWRTLARHLPAPSAAAGAAAAARNDILTKPPGALGRLESLAIWLSEWQGRHPPRLDRVRCVVFAGNHGIVRHGVSAFPAAVTQQMVANFAAGGAAINQLCRAFDIELDVQALDLDRPTADFTEAPAMPEVELLDALATGWRAARPETDLLIVGEMGIGNTTAAAALAAALFGGGGAAWAGPGTGLDPDGVSRKAAAIDLGLGRHGAALADPLAALGCLGGREIAAMAGAILRARLMAVPVLLDGFVCSAAAAVWARQAPGALDHAEAGHVSAEPAHRRLLERLGKTPLLDLGMRLGEASGAAAAVPLLRAAVATHVGMASFAEAGISGKS